MISVAETTTVCEDQGRWEQRASMCATSTYGVCGNGGYNPCGNYGYNCAGNGCHGSSTCGGGCGSTCGNGCGGNAGMPGTYMVYSVWVPNIVQRQVPVTVATAADGQRTIHLPGFALPHGNPLSDRAGHGLEARKPHSDGEFRDVRAGDSPADVQCHDPDGGRQTADGNLFCLRALDRHSGGPAPGLSHGSEGRADANRCERGIRTGKFLLWRRIWNRLFDLPTFSIDLSAVVLFLRTIGNLSNRK